MLNNFEDESLIRSYLLGGLDDAEQQAIEKRLLIDDDFYGHLLIIEDEMAYDYVRGSLPASERAQIEKSLLRTPGGRRTVSFNQALRKYVSEVSAVSPVEDSSRGAATGGRAAFGAFA